MSTYTYQHWQHKRSGEVYAVRLKDGQPDAVDGPLHYTDIGDPSDCNYDDPAGDWFDPDDYRLYEDVLSTAPLSEYARGNTLRLVAHTYVKDARKEPQTWHQLPDPHGESMDQVVYGEEVWTVGSNGDFDDYYNIEEASEALHWSWTGDLDNMLADGEITQDEIDTLIRDAALSIGLILS